MDLARRPRRRAAAPAVARRARDHPLRRPARHRAAPAAGGPGRGRRGDRRAAVPAGAPAAVGREPSTALTRSRWRERRRDGDGWVLDGAKRWIGNGSIADVVVVWARSADDSQVKGFLVEKGTEGSRPSRRRARERRGRSGRPRSADGVQVPRRRGCGRRLLKDAGRVLVTTRTTCAWGALGHAVALRRGADRQQAAQAVRQAAVPYRRPGPLVKMPRDHRHAALLVQPPPSRSAASPTRSPAWQAQQHPQGRQVIAEARDLLGGNGVCSEPRHLHMGDIEVIYTYEGTETMQT